jgi:hypothetical protein
MLFGMLLGLCLLLLLLELGVFFCCFLLVCWPFLEFAVVY